MITVGRVNCYVVIIVTVVYIVAIFCYVVTFIIVLLMSVLMLYVLCVLLIMLIYACLLLFVHALICQVDDGVGCVVLCCCDYFVFRHSTRIFLMHM